MKNQLEYQIHGILLEVWKWRKYDLAWSLNGALVIQTTAESGY